MYGGLGGIGAASSVALNHLKDEYATPKQYDVFWKVSLIRREAMLAGIPFLLLEASDGVGGRVRTDTEAGFLLDRGFQIFLTSYPECKVR